MAKETRHLLDEEDIGSGEHNAGQDDVEKDVASVRSAQVGDAQDGSQLKTVIEEQAYAEQPHPEQERASAEKQPQEKIIQSGTHLARITSVLLTDGLYEGQVYVRLTREPDIAETYIPVGTFGSEEQALAAAEERARRAIEQNEF
ncbi:MAG: hypothetical protein K0S28_894 [Paucimonas sp.]|nr:hypothetical protein [Paucimonas sp.]